MHVKLSRFMIAAAFVLAAALGLRVAVPAWENHRLREGFVPSDKFSSYREGVPMEDMDLSQYGFLWDVTVALVYTPMDFPLGRDLVYYDAPGGEPVYTIPAGTRLWWESFSDCTATYPTYTRGWRWARPMAPQGVPLPQGHYYVPLESLEAAARDLLAASKAVEQDRIQAGLSVEEAVRRLVLYTDEEFYRQGVCLSPDLLRPLWGWECWALAGLSLLAGAGGLALRRRE